MTKSFLKVLRVKKTPLFDVFIGDGWTNHCRVYYKKNSLSFVGVGVKLTPREKEELKVKINQLNKAFAERQLKKKDQSCVSL